MIEIIINILLAIFILLFIRIKNRNHSDQMDAALIDIDILKKRVEKLEVHSIILSNQIISDLVRIKEVENILSLILAGSNSDSETVH